MIWLIAVMLIGGITALASRYFFGTPVLTFCSAVIALIPMSKVMNDATDQLSHRTGQRMAGFINVLISNLPELIFIFIAIQAGLFLMVQGGIVGSIIGNLSLVMGGAIIVGCHKHGTLKLNPHTVTIFINQFYLVAVVLFLPSLFAESIPQKNQLPMSYFFAAMLFGAYIIFSLLAKKDERFDVIEEQSKQINHHWSIKKSVTVLALMTLGAIMMSKLLTDEVEIVATGLGISQSFIGFIIAPVLMNVAEHMVAITAARKGMTELSMAVAVGSASQISMVVAPCAVLFGWLLGSPFTLYFTGIPFGLLIISLIGTFLVLRDNQWNISEGVMLLGLYTALIIAFSFTQ